ncbi:MAG: hypothetical protein HY644_08005 [Acidobacteria bacterium]|nr:hypothetical protein [Acidobacteriota bacterium]
MESSNAIIELKQRIAAVYSHLCDRFSEFPKGRETWYELARGEQFECEALKRLGENSEWERDRIELESLSNAIQELDCQARRAELGLDEAYRISWDISRIQVELMALIMESVEFPQSLEIKNIAAMMSASLVNLYNMIEKSMSPQLRGVMSRTRVQLIALNLTFLELDIKNYLTAILGLSYLLAGESTGEQMKKLLDETHQYCTVVRNAMVQLERIRTQLRYSECEQ